MRTPPQSIPMGDTLTSLGIQGGHETDPITPQPSHPIPKQIHRGVADDVSSPYCSHCPLTAIIEIKYDG